MAVLVAHPSPDVYGSDLQLVESVTAMVAADWQVTVCLPSEGPLTGRLRSAGASVWIVRFPVLRRAVMSPAGLLRLALTSPVALMRMIRAIRASRARVVYVNTVTIPWWLLAARLCRRPALCHVHEAEDDAPRLVRTALAAPLFLASAIVTNSQASERALLAVLPGLRRRTTVIVNGVPMPAQPLPDTGEAGRLVLVGRLSPRKGTDVALEAVALLRGEGRDVRLDVCGSVYPGYEWFQQELYERAERPDLAGAVRLHGYVSPGPLLAKAAIVLVPSRTEPFGNTAVEGLLAGRPVVASDVQGLPEIIDSGRTGLLVPPGDATALASAVAKLLDDPGLAARLADAGRREAADRFSLATYRRAIRDVVGSLTPAR
jgi:glycosyltransferase involved in cell wall biosynthesis